MNTAFITGHHVSTVHTVESAAASGASNVLGNGGLGTDEEGRVWVTPLSSSSWRGGIATPSLVGVVAADVYVLTECLAGTRPVSVSKWAVVGMQ